MANLPVKRSSSTDITAFLDAASKTPTLPQVKGRLIFAVDATMSRQPTWDAATEIQSDMFEVAQSVGGLGVQLVYFRGRGEFAVSEWTTTPAALAARMRRVSTRSGFTQLRRVLTHAKEESRRTRVGALVYVGDCFEENPDVVAKEAGALALLGRPSCSTKVTIPTLPPCSARSRASRMVYMPVLIPVRRGSCEICCGRRPCMPRAAGRRSTALPN
jgi:hypothetical protein